MCKKIALCLMVLFNALTVLGQKEVLKFNRDGKFKIVQFTDVHYKYDDQANSQISLDRINEVLDAERPDFVMFTGDVVVSNEAFKGLDIVLEPCIRRNIPFGVIFGNHDDEYDRTRAELYDYLSQKKGSMMPAREGEVAPDYVLTVKSSKDKNKNAALLYCIDSHAYTQIKSVPGYDWIKFDQIAWYRNQSKEFTKQNRLFGVRGEGVACPTTNSGLFTSIKECGDVMGTFVGHDHNNDYAVMYKEVLLAYGRYTGGNTVYNNLANGARVIILQEGERKFDSYIRLAGGEIESRISYPGSFN